VRYFQIIIQARQTSTRLPGKALLQLGDQTVIERIYHTCDIVGPTIVAIPNSPGNDALAVFLKQRTIPFIRGPETNVLKRFYMAWVETGRAPNVVRITADCPLLPSSMIARALEQHLLDNPSGYTSNTILRTYPKGFDVEIFSSDLLENAYNNTEKLYELEHVTPHIQKNALKRSHVIQPVDQSMFNVCLDTPEDYSYLQKLVAKES
jgi:spore coat polysaccharide biosynthesis protein SpsF